jgi:hypothetical protein
MYLVICQALPYDWANSYLCKACALSVVNAWANSNKGRVGTR